VESDPHHRAALEASHTPAQGTVADAVCASMREAANLLPAAAIVTYTRSGYTSLRAARERPAVPVLCMTPELATARRLVLGWGVHSVHMPQAIQDVPDMVAQACALARSQGFASGGDNVFVAAGMPFGTAGTTNFLHIAKA
jgi:pyruvate kinase